MSDLFILSDACKLGVDAIGSSTAAVRVDSSTYFGLKAIVGRESSILYLKTGSPMDQASMLPGGMARLQAAETSQ